MYSLIPNLVYRLYHFQYWCQYQNNPMKRAMNYMLIQLGVVEMPMIFLNVLGYNVDEKQLIKAAKICFSLSPD